MNFRNFIPAEWVRYFGLTPLPHVSETQFRSRPATSQAPAIEYFRSDFH